MGLCCSSANPPASPANNPPGTSDNVPPATPPNGHLRHTQRGFVTGGREPRGNKHPIHN
ncbi:hypothetical protein PAHAL_4G099000 [Panicum hallii]|uniref:Uncharacterized protein n=1 Tax=Panicum hallii TaxID=206008 RepID=A0A2T8JCF4_9POAL|nr:hypothetical protein PAHAL_4G099000 [Panicum hallii]